MERRSTLVDEDLIQGEVLVELTELGEQIDEYSQSILTMIESDHDGKSMIFPLFLNTTSIYLINIYTRPTHHTLQLDLLTN